MEKGITLKNLEEIKRRCARTIICKECKFHYITDNDIYCLFEVAPPSEWNIEAIRRNFYDIQSD